ncbi:MAG: UDP-N-acetylmuramoyl-L-alanine--D-glutamate ligase [Elusimicrobiota bacterium]|jgi:UDP-N-acetylmuramoylalanine--D-glutamate ligase|nr:UDP-N-acetylmuramoyl-L-alanine--D-glutamate ligase [Elusimicrobiota bacterium]
MKKIAILGLGKSGIAAANLAVKLNHKVFASDNSPFRIIKNLNKKVGTEFGVHSDKILDCDVIIKSPGINPNVSILKKALKKNIKVVSELKFALQFSKYKKLISITGTNGKTTVVDLISKIIKGHYKDSITAGNIGFPLSAKSLKTSKNTIIVMELSSYQLEDTPDLQSDVSVLLNITPDHLEHHKTMASYIKAKGNIFKNQTGSNFAIINYDDQLCRKISSKIKPKKIYFSKKFLKEGVFWDDGKIIIKILGKKVAIKPKINMIGFHNIENILAASAVAFCAGIPPKKIEKTISHYKGIPHRIEYVAEVNGIKIYNDSKSTNIDSTRVALSSFDKNILLIMGGLGKGIPYTPLKKLIEERVKTIFLIGKDARKIRKDLKNCTRFILSKNIENTVKDIFKEASSGDVVLFSPACASFDQFKNFEERGNYFKKIFLAHIKKNKS